MSSSSSPAQPLTKRRKFALPPVSKSFLDDCAGAAFLGDTKPRQDASRITTTSTTTRREENAENRHMQRFAGRKRQVPHIEGNFPSFVFVRVSIDDELTKKVLGVAKLRTGITFTANEECHISLSKTFYLHFPQIEQYFSVLCSHLKHRKSFEFRFELTPSFYINEDHSRSFVSLNVAAGKQDFCALIGRVNRAMNEFKQEQYYDDPKPHTSLGWTLGDVAAPYIERSSDSNDNRDSTEGLPQVPELDYAVFHCSEVVFRSGVYDYAVKLLKDE